MPSPEILLFYTFLFFLLLSAVFWPERGLFARWQRGRRLNTRVLMEDALKHLFTCEMEERMPSLESVAGVLSVSPNEAADIVSALVQREFIDAGQGVLSLTEIGREYAVRIVRAHRLWERYLSEKTGYSETEWHDLAELHEHNLSPDDADELAVMLGNPSHDPHGDPIPTAAGEHAGRHGVSLSSIEAGNTVKIIHIEDEPAGFYSQIIAEGLHTGMYLRILESSARRIRFWAEGNEHVLAPLLAANISVRPVQREISETAPGLPLNELSVGEVGRVISIAPGIRGAERRRLMDLGLLPGTDIRAELRSPSGDPTAYIVRGALVALRSDQAQHIKVNKEKTTS